VKLVAIGPSHRRAEVFWSLVLVLTVASGDLKADERSPIQITGPEVVCLSDQTIDFTVKNKSNGTVWVSIGIESRRPPKPWRGLW
jgi:hypothetical protein